MPNNCTDILQLLDLSVNKPFKDKLRKGFLSAVENRIEVSEALVSATFLESDNDRFASEYNTNC